MFKHKPTKTREKYNSMLNIMSYRLSRSYNINYLRKNTNMDEDFLKIIRIKIYSK